MNRTRTIFEFDDYKSYVSAWVASQPRGVKSKMAQAARCQLAYISQVLKGHAHFSLEQAEALNLLFGHTDEEIEFFLLLVQRGRAGTPSLRRHFEKKIQRTLDQRLLLKNRLSDKKALGPEDHTTYYSHWAYSALHIAVLVPELRTPQNLARHFGLDLARVNQVLKFLVSSGLVIKRGNEYFSGEARIHLENDSPMISKHHSNWRLQAMQSLERESPSELHYSSVMGISRSDLPKVREILVRAIEDARGLIRNSKDETVYCYCLDLFGLGKS